MGANYLISVYQFMKKHGQPVSQAPKLAPMPLADFRLRLIEEEFEELKEAVSSHNLYLIADALADLKYVIFGMDLTYGIPADSVFDEVHRSNMTKEKKVVEIKDEMIKLNPNPQHPMKVQKGSTYSPPQIRELIDSAIRVDNG